MSRAFSFKNLFTKIYNYAASRIYRFCTLRLLYPAYYARFAKAPVSPKKVLFVEVRSPDLTDSFTLVYEKFVAEGYRVEAHFLAEGRLGIFARIRLALAFLKSMATARYVFINDACNVTSCVDKRGETLLVQLWHACGAFKKFGYSTAELLFGVSRDQMDKYPYYRNIDLITVSSPRVSWAYEQAMNSEKFGSQVVATGVSRTDVFFCQSFFQQARQALYAAVPQARGRKLILYAPTFRGSVKAAKSPEALDIPAMKGALGQEYYLLIKHHPFVKQPPQVPQNCADFACDVTGCMSIDRLLAISDLCISDYSSLIFEFSLFERPMIFLAHDIDDYNDWRGFYYSYDEMTPGPVVKTTAEILDYIAHLDTRFDRELVRRFREKFMSACDGSATERIYRLLTAGDSPQQKDISCEKTTKQ